MNTEVPKVSPQEVVERKRRGETVHLVDVRTPGEYAALHAQGARLVPLERFDDPTTGTSLGLDTGTVGVGEPLYLLCQSGNRAMQAAAKLIDRGYCNVHVLEGGTDRWAQAGLPVVRGKGVISIQRQVQIAIGALVIVKVLFGFTLSPVFFGLVALIGVGLVFAGLTENCAMAKLIARMPWNGGHSCQSQQLAS